MKPEELAESVVDNVPVDWEAVERSASPAQLPLVRQMRLVASIADVQRTISAGEDTTTTLAPPAPPLPPQWGRLQIQSVIGQGAHGVVYRAFDPQLLRTVALKLRPIGMARPEDPMLTEARLLARVRHPNVVSVYGVAVEGNAVGIWMELIEGRTLSDLIAQGGQLGAGEAAIVGIALCRALAAVHAAGLVHRDIKASNVMREHGGRIVLMDFGAGIDLGLADAQTSGTPLYLAPEILGGAPASARSDIYAMGVLLFHLVTRRFPVEGGAVREIRAAHAAGGRVLLRDLRPDLPETFVRAVNRCLDPAPDQRHATAGELEQALQQIAPDAAPGPLAGKVTRRAALLAGALGAAVAASLAVLVVSGIWSAPPAPAADGPIVVVVPFANATGNPELDHVGRAFTDLLITHLARYQRLRVQSRAALVASGATAEAWHAAAERLDAGYVVRGTLLGSAHQLSTTIHLVEVATNRTVWSLDDRLADDEYLRRPLAVAGMLASRLGVRAQPYALPARDIPAAAQEAYYLGLSEANAGDPSRAAVALLHFRRAVDLAPAFAEAWAAMALQYIVRANSAAGENKGAMFSQARTAAATALAQDPRLGEAHTALGTIAFNHEWNWAAADAAFRRAVELSPGDAFVHQRYSMFLAAIGQIDQAIDAARLAQAIEPQVPTRSSSLATIYYYARRYDDAAAEMQHALDLSASFATAHYGLGRVYAAQERFAEARTQLASAIDLGSAVSGLLELARVHALEGDRAGAERQLQRLQDLQPLANITPDNLAFVDAAVGDLDTAFARLEQALAVRAGNLLWIAVDPRFDPMRADPRFAAIVARIGLPTR